MAVQLLSYNKSKVLLLLNQLELSYYYSFNNPTMQSRGHITINKRGAVEEAAPVVNTYPIS